MNRENYQLIIASDIFGTNDALVTLASLLKSSYRSVKIFTPYVSPPSPFINEEAAYQYFVTQGGHQSYFQRLESLVKNISKPIVIIGFSAGASALWQLVAKLKFTAALGFYPSQIRKHLNLLPKTHTTLIFPKYEKLFSVNNTIEALKNKPLTHSVKSKFLHGFMNTESENFSQEAKNNYQTFILAWLEDIDRKKR